MKTYCNGSRFCECINCERAANGLPSISDEVLRRFRIINYPMTFTSEMDGTTLKVRATQTYRIVDTGIDE